MSVSIIGAGMVPVREHWSKGISELAGEAAALALEDAGFSDVDALYIGNAYSATYSRQTQLGSLIARYCGLGSVESFTCEAGDASGGAALRAAYLALAAGAVRSALVIGVEKATDIVGSGRLAARNVSLDADFEAVNGATLTALAGLLMRRYMHEYKLDLSQFEGFSLNAHRNGALNPMAMFRRPLRAGAFAKAPMLSDPVSLFDSAPDADGAAALVLVRGEHAADLVPNPVDIVGSALRTDSLMLQDRADILRLEAVSASAAAALAQANMTLDDIDVMELHDAYTILTALALEALGLSERGGGWAWAEDAGRRIALDGDMPISSFGGLKSRGNPSGATGIYQAVEAALQLRGEAGDNQAAGAKHALVQNIGGLGATVATHILSAAPD